MVIVMYTWSLLDEYTLLLGYHDNGTMRRFIERLLVNITRIGNFGYLYSKDLGGNLVDGYLAATSGAPCIEDVSHVSSAVLRRWQHRRSA